MGGHRRAGRQGRRAADQETRHQGRI